MCVCVCVCLYVCDVQQPINASKGEDPGHLLFPETSSSTQESGLSHVRGRAGVEAEAGGWGGWVGEGGGRGEGT